jgi:stage II sporulation protein D
MRETEPAITEGGRRPFRWRDRRPQPTAGRWSLTIAAGLVAAALLSCATNRAPSARPVGARPSAQPPWYEDTERRRPRQLGRPLRVGIVVNAASTGIAAVRLGATGKGQGADGAPLLELVTTHQATLGFFASLDVSVTGEARGLRIATPRHGTRELADTLRVRPPPDARLRVGDSIYRGELELYRGPGGDLTVVNLVDLEEYLLGVVPLEIGSPGPEARAAVETQAVAARTYVLAHLGRWPAEGFDAYGDVRDQVYGGAGAERDECSAAVRATRGAVAVHDGLMIGAFYSACCGGHTASGHETWDFPPIPYLIGHQDRKKGADFCAGSRHYRWQEEWTAAEMMALLAAHYDEEFGAAIPARGTLEDLVIEERFASGRVARMTVRVDGRRYELGGDRIRWVLRRGGVGGAILRSSHVEVEVERRGGRVARIVARGRGNGHGVGMCQTGAIEMARQGYDVEAILGHYYPGVVIVRTPAT